MDNIFWRRDGEFVSPHPYHHKKECTKMLLLIHSLIQCFRRNLKPIRLPYYRHFQDSTVASTDEVDSCCGDIECKTVSVAG